VQAPVMRRQFRELEKRPPRRVEGWAQVIKAGFAGPGSLDVENP
jgi:hypothetical protein